MSKATYTYRAQNERDYKYIYDLVKELKLCIERITTEVKEETKNAVYILQVSGEECYLQFAGYLYRKYRNKIRKMLTEAEKSNVSMSK